MKDHLHTYQKMKTQSGRKDMYKCIHPDCRHYAARELLLGKYANCKFCFTKFILTPYALQLKSPHCGCRGLTEMQRDKLREFSTSIERQEELAMRILQNTLKIGT